MHQLSLNVHEKQMQEKDEEVKKLNEYLESYQSKTKNLITLMQQCEERSAKEIYDLENELLEKNIALKTLQLENSKGKGRGTLYQTTLVPAKNVIVDEEMTKDVQTQSNKELDRKDMTVDSVKNESPKTEKLYEPKMQEETETVEVDHAETSIVLLMG